MAGSFHDDWENEGYFKYLNSREHDSFCKKIQADRRKGILTNIPEELQHPVWGVIKDSITETLALWQVALLYYPFRDKINTDHPQAFNFKNRRRYVVFDLLDSIYAGELKLFSIPKPEIESTVHFESAPLEYQVKAKIHVNDLAEAIRAFKVSSVYSTLVKQWRILATKRSKPTLGFMDAPEAPRVIRYFSYPFAWMKPSENGELRDCIEGIPKSLTYPRSPEVRMMDTRDEWLRHRLSPDSYDAEIKLSHWFQEQLKGIHADLNKGILSYPLLDTPRYLNNMLETRNNQPITVHTENSIPINPKAIQPNINEFTTNTSEEIFGDCKRKYPVLVDHSKTIETSQLLEPSSKKCQSDEIQWVLKAPERERDVYFLFERLVSIHGTEAINPSSLWAIIFSGDARLSSFVEIVSYSAEMPTRAIFKDKVANRERDFKWFEKAFKRLFVRLEIKGN